MRVLLIAAFLIFVLGLGAVLFLPGFVDVGDYRDKISQTIEEIAGRKVKINGAVSFNVLPTPRIAIEKLSIANLEGAKHEDFLTIEKLEGEISLISLIKGDVKMSNLVLISPTLNFDVSETGEKAWQSNTAQNNENVFKRVATGIHFNTVKVQDGIIRYSNEQTKKEHEVIGIMADITAEDVKGPFAVKGTSLYKDNDVQFSIVGGKVTAEGSSPVRVELLSDKAALSADFAGVVTVFEDADQAMEAQGETNIQIRDINRLESFSFIGGMEASFVKAKGFITLDQDKLQITNVSGEIGKTPFTAKSETVFLGDGKTRTNTAFKAAELHFIGVKAKDIGDEKGLISKLPNGEIDLELGEAHFEDGILEDVKVKADKSASVFLVKEAQAVLPGQTNAQLSEYRIHEQQKVATMNLIINNPQEFFKWANFKLLQNPNFSANEKISLGFSYNQGMTTDGLKGGYSFDFSQNGKSFKATYSSTLDQKPLIRELSIIGDSVDFDQLGYSKMIAESIKDNSWIKDQNWEITIDVDHARYQEQDLKDLSISINSKGPDIGLDGFYVENFYGSTVNAKGHFDIEANAKPFDVLVNVKSDDLKKLIDNVPFVIEFPSYDYGESDLNVSFSRKEAGKTLALSGKMLGADWQMEGELDDLAFKGNYNLTLRTSSNNLESFFSHFGKDTDLSLLKDKQGDFYTVMAKEGENVKFSQLKGTVDGSTFNGSFHLIDKKLTIGLDVDAINLDKNKTYLSLAKGIIDRNDINGVFDIKTKKATFGKQVFDTVNANGSFDKDKITIAKMPLSWSGKPHQVKGTVDWKGAYDFDITTDHFDIASFKHGLPISTSDASAKTKLKGSDGDYTGESTIEFKPGKLTKMNLAGVSAGIKGAASVTNLLNANFSQGETPFTFAKVTTDFDTTEMNVKSFEIAGNFGKINGSKGTYTFADKSYSFDMDVNLISPEAVPSFSVTYSNKGNSFSADDLEGFSKQSVLVPVQSPVDTEMDEPFTPPAPEEVPPPVPTPVPAPVAPPAPQGGSDDSIGDILERLEQEQGAGSTPTTPNTLQDIDREEPATP